MKIRGYAGYSPTELLYFKDYNCIKCCKGNPVLQQMMLVCSVAVILLHNGIHVDHGMRYLWVKVPKARSGG